MLEIVSEVSIKTGIDFHSNINTILGGYTA